MKWTHDLTSFFLEEYLKRKAQFRDPNRTKMSSWNEIFKVFQEHGYCDEDDTSSDFLQNKFRNLKKTYMTIKSNPERKSITWPYYQIMTEIVGDECYYILKVDDCMDNVEKVSLPYLLDQSADDSTNGPTPAKRRKSTHDHDECHCEYLQEYRTRKLQLEEQKLDQFERLISAVESMNEREGQIISLLETVVAKLDPQPLSN